MYFLFLIGKEETRKKDMAENEQLRMENEAINDLINDKYEYSRV